MQVQPTRQAVDAAHHTHGDRADRQGRPRDVFDAAGKIALSFVCLTPTATSAAATAAATNTVTIATTIGWRVPPSGEDSSSTTRWGLLDGTAPPIRLSLGFEPGAVALASLRPGYLV
jgi:hypothetical protein